MFVRFFYHCTVGATAYNQAPTEFQISGEEVNDIEARLICCVLVPNNPEPVVSSDKPLRPLLFGSSSSSRKIFYDWLVKQCKPNNNTNAKNTRAATHKKPVRKEASESCYLTVLF